MPKNTPEFLFTNEGLFVNENVESIEWTWHNGQGLAFTPEPIEFEPGLAVTQAKINAIHNYNDHERQPMSSYNIQRNVCATLRILVKWAAGGSKNPPKVDPEDMASNPATSPFIVVKTYDWTSTGREKPREMRTWTVTTTRYVSLLSPEFDVDLPVSTIRLDLETANDKY
ncbi:hypothetical protein FPANT_11302 [Fusarium pseudoanthophilum]|uniref:Uncharacterized protein n=1 Tax=Fusarium pseudoanthophilum TaxID=48495 RepID=A0A8H5NQN7_9HYPO|nr:hypothetical protein FPANT_11302 [Fusarium pseudoanthophilum]